MGHQEILGKTNESESASYKIITCKAVDTNTQYYNMLISKYLRALRYGNDFFKRIEPDAYFKIHTAYFNSLMKRPNATIRLAVLTDNEDVVLGWSLMENTILHFVWVGGDYRRLGIATALVQRPVTAITHFTKTALPILKKKLPEVIFNPYLL
jgi:hypothetical protein